MGCDINLSYEFAKQDNAFLQLDASLNEIMPAGLIAATHTRSRF